MLNVAEVSENSDNLCRSGGDWKISGFKSGPGKRCWAKPFAYHRNTSLRFSSAIYVYALVRLRVMPPLTPLKTIPAFKTLSYWPMVRLVMSFLNLLQLSFDLLGILSITSDPEFQKSSRINFNRGTHFHP